MAWEKRVLRWPFELDASNNDIYVADAADMMMAAVAIPAGTYITDDDGGVSPDDFVAALATALVAGYDAVNAPGGVFSVDLLTSGHLRITNASPNGIILKCSDPMHTLDPYLMGFGDLAQYNLPVGVTDSTYQASHAWYPDEPHIDDSWDAVSHAAASCRAPNGRASYVVHSDMASPPVRRRIAWDYIRSARIRQAFADDATAAAAAGVTWGDPNCTLETLIAYLLENSGPEPGRVYIYSTDDPATHVQSGPYYVDLPDEIVAFGGIPFDAQMDDVRQRRFEVALEFAR